MKISPFLKEVIWSLYPPRYKELSEKRFSESVKHMAKVLAILCLLASLLFVPTIINLKDDIESGFKKFTAFSLAPSISQSDEVTIPQDHPWIRVNLNTNLTLKEELFVVDQSTVQYRLLGIKSIEQKTLLDPATNVAQVSGFASTILTMLLPGIGFFLYVRMLLKYFLLVVLMGTLAFIVLELTKFKLKYKEALNIAAFAITPILALEVLPAPINTDFLLPVFRFVGIDVFAIPIFLFIGMMVFGIVGYHIGSKRKK